MRKYIIILIGIAFSLGMIACSDETANKWNGSEPVSEEILQASENDNESANEPDSDRSSKETTEENSETESQANVNGTENETKNSETDSKTISETDSEAESETQKEYVVVPCSDELFVIKMVNVRTGPSTDYDRLGSLQKGDKISVTGMVDNSWYQFQYQGVNGYVSSKYLVDEESYRLLEQEEKNSEPAEKKSENPEGNSEEEKQEETSPSNDSETKQQLVDKMNEERQANGVSEISHSAELDALAQIRAEEIYQSFSHTRPDGSSCFTILSGVAYSTAGENIAAGQKDVGEVMDAWMNSPGHRSNILNPSFGKVGIGYFVAPDGYGIYWVQLFTD